MGRKGRSLQRITEERQAATAHQARGDLRAALASLDQAERRAARHDDAQHELQLWHVLHARAVILWRLKQLDDALAVTERLLARMRRRVRHNEAGESLLTQVMELHTRLLGLTGRRVEAASTARALVDHARGLHATNPGRYAGVLARSLHLQAIGEALTGGAVNGARAAAEAVTLLRTTESDPLVTQDRAAPSMPTALHLLVTMRWAARDRAGALAAQQELAAISESAGTPADLATALLRLGDVHGAAYPDHAAEAFDRGLGALGPASPEQDDVAARRLRLDLLLKAALAHIHSNNFAAARSRVDAAIKVISGLATDDPRTEVSQISLLNLHAMLSTREPSAVAPAVDAAEEAVRRCRVAVSTGATKPPMLAAVLDTYAEVLIATGAADSGLSAATEAIGILDRATYGRVAVLITVARALAATGNVEDARAMAETAVVEADELVADTPEGYTNLVSRARKLHAELASGP